jgi:hypothetical protein
MENIEKIKKFIEDNNLDFNDEGSGLNSACTILAGYACHLEFTPKNIQVILDLMPSLSAKIEFERVFEYADINFYGDFWTTMEAVKMYKF